MIVNKLLAMNDIMVNQKKPFQAEYFVGENHTRAQTLFKLNLMTWKKNAKKNP